MKGAARPPSQSKGIWNGGGRVDNNYDGKEVDRPRHRRTQVFHLQLPSSVDKSEMHSAPVNLDLTSGKRIPILFGIFAKTCKNESDSSKKT